MKIHVLSDLHLEHGSFDLPEVDADVLVLAGDVGEGLKGLEWAGAVRDRYDAVIYVAGNHEYWGHSIDRLDSEMLAAADSLGIDVLQDDWVVVGDTMFLGCTLWTDFCVGIPLGMSLGAAMAAADRGMVDYRRISGGRLRAEHTAQRHRQSIAWLGRQLAREWEGPTVVVTHHAPVAEAIAPRHYGSALNGAFASDLSRLIEASGPDLWICGHTHHCIDMRVGGTRVLSNQRGYPGEATSGFRPDLVVDVGGHAEIENRGSRRQHAG